MRATLGRTVKEELSGETAKSYVAQITRFHRVQASTMFHEAAEYLRDTIKNLGCSDVRIEQFASDGQVEYGTHISPIGWEAREATLSLVKPHHELVVRYTDVPTCLHTYSNATPPEGITAELIDVGEGTKPEHYNGKDVQGKLVLATGKARQVHEQAVYKYGAAGVITDSLTHEMKHVRESVDIPDAHAYQSIWPTGDEMDKVAFGFSISKRQGNHLRGMLRNNQSVTLKAMVDARLFPGNLDVVTARIPGSSKPEEEIFLVAHLCHPKPSANDNASGSGLLLEIARTIQTLIRNGSIGPLGRTIRFLWVPENYGTLALLLHDQDWASKLVAGINLDMVGQNQELCRSTLNLDKTPDSNPSFLNDYISTLFSSLKEEFDCETAYGSASTFRHNVNAFSGGSDHAEFNDSTFSIPCVMLVQWPDLFYHSSFDTLDKVSTDSLKRVGWIATVAAITLANARVDDAAHVANLTRLRGMSRLHSTSEEALKALPKQAEDPDHSEIAHRLAEMLSDFESRMRHVTRREQRAIESVKRLGADSGLNRLIKSYIGDIDRCSQLEVRRFKETLDRLRKSVDVYTSTPQEKTEKTEVDEKARSIIPKRLFKGTFSWETFKKRLGELEYEWYERMRKKDRNLGKKTYEIFNFMDGKHTAYDIAVAVSIEYDEVDKKYMLRFLHDLERTHFVSLQ